MSKEQSQEYRGNGNHTWEPVTGTPGYYVTRLRVPGGWIYSDHRNSSNVFVPMPEVVKHAV